MVTGKTRINSWTGPLAPIRKRTRWSEILGALGVGAVISHLPIAYPVATGAALAYKRRSEPRVAMAICGDVSTRMMWRSPRLANFI